jgi:hypothetical protein
LEPEGKARQLSDRDRPGDHLASTPATQRPSEPSAPGVPPPGPFLAPHAQGAVFDATCRAMAQVGWLGQAGAVYGLHDQLREGREPGGFRPLYIQVGVYQQVDNGDGTTSKILQD